MWLSKWREKKAVNDIQGYEHSDLVETVVRRTAALLQSPRIDDAVAGEVLTPTLLALAAAERDDPHVLDFGGAAGLHYLAARQAFPTKRFHWAVVETPTMVAAATLGSDVLRFFPDPSEAANWLGRVDVMHSNGALQYLDEPEAMLQRLIGLRAPVMLWARMLLGERRERFSQSSRLTENGPGSVPSGLVDRTVVYDATRIPRADFLAQHTDAGYRLAWKARDTESYLFIRS
jgi:putative methyltransferase (TIGR04325 family)